MRNVYAEKEAQRLKIFDNLTTKVLKPTEAANKRDFFIKSNAQLTPHIRKASISNFSMRSDSAQKNRSYSAITVEQDVERFRHQTPGKDHTSEIAPEFGNLFITTNNFQTDNLKLEDKPSKRVNWTHKIAIDVANTLPLDEKNFSPKRVKRSEQSQHPTASPKNGHPRKFSKNSEKSIADVQHLHSNGESSPLLKQTPKLTLASTTLVTPSQSHKKEICMPYFKSNQLLGKIFGDDSTVADKLQTLLIETQEENNQTPFSISDQLRRKPLSNNTFNQAAQKNIEDVLQRRPRSMSTAQKKRNQPLQDQKILRMKPSSELEKEKNLLLQNNRTEIAIQHKLAFLDQIKISRDLQEISLEEQKINLYTDGENKSIENAKRRIGVMNNWKEARKSSLKHSHRSLDILLSRLKPRDQFSNDNKALIQKLSLEMKEVHSNSQVKLNLVPERMSSSIPNKIKKAEFYIQGASCGNSKKRGLDKSTSFSNQHDTMKSIHYFAITKSLVPSDHTSHLMAKARHRRSLSSSFIRTAVPSTPVGRSSPTSTSSNFVKNRLTSTTNLS